MTPEEIRQYRERLKMTQAELGAALDVSGNTVARWERGELQPQAPKMLRYALEHLYLQRLLPKDLKLVKRIEQLAATRQELQELISRSE